MELLSGIRILHKPQTENWSKLDRDILALQAFSYSSEKCFVVISYLPEPDSHAHSREPVGVFYK